MMRAAAAGSSSSASGGPTVHFYCSSGGNAGLACATTALALGCAATICVPTTTPAHMVARLRALGSAGSPFSPSLPVALGVAARPPPVVTVHQVGRDWAAADRFLREELMPLASAAAAAAAAGAQNNTNSGGGGVGTPPPVKAVYVPPFDHADIWAGASSLVGELDAQFAAAGGAAAAASLHLTAGTSGLGAGRGVDGVVCSVGGGGLLCGIMEGLARLPGGGGRIGGDGRGVVGPDGNNEGRGPTEVLAVETAGADSLHHAAVVAGSLEPLPGGITSIATSLGAVQVARRAFEWAEACGRASATAGTKRSAAAAAGVLTCAVVSDAEAVTGCVGLADDARILVEPACGATVATAYKDGGRFLRRWLGGGCSDDEWARRNVVLVVCGGSNISLDILEAYRAKYLGGSGRN